MKPSVKILIWLFFVVVAIFLIGFNPNPDGFLVTSSAVPQISDGDVIFSIAGMSPEDGIKQNFSGIVEIITQSGEVFIRANGTIPIDLEHMSSTNLLFGLDLKGGVRALLKPQDKVDLEQVKNILEQRINVFGLRDASFRTVTIGDTGFIEVSMAGASLEELRELLERQGKFEARIPVTVKFPGTIKIYEVHEIDDSLRIGDQLDLDGIVFEVANKTSSSIVLISTVFTGEDIKTVFIDPQRSRIEPTETNYFWSFGVQLSPEGAERFAKITQNLGVLPDGHLDSPIMFFLDNELLDQLQIASSLRGQVATEVSITGGSVTMEEAVRERASLQSILRSGALPTSLEIESLEEISPTLGNDFLQNAIFAGFGAILGVAAVITVRYRKIKFILPMITISLSEVLIILGASVAIGWTIDLPSIAGIIAAVGTGVDSQIIIIDQALRGISEESLYLKLKRAFFVIFGAGGVTIAAMLPLWFSGLGLLRGFATITILGVLVGILITRPAFGSIIEKLV